MLPGGKQFVISTDNLSTANRYVQSVTLNGRPLTRTYLRDDEIRQGG